MFSELEIKALMLNPCFALRFLLDIHPRAASREQMPDCKDSAIFFRLWDMGDLLDEPETIEVLDPHLRVVVKKFQNVMNHLPWQTVPAHPQTMELPDDDLSPLMEPGRELYKALSEKLGL